MLLCFDLVRALCVLLFCGCWFSCFVVVACVRAVCVCLVCLVWIVFVPFALV